MSEQEQRADFVASVFNVEAALSSAVEWIAANLGPQEVYDRATLEEWARLNGWTPPQE